jgi:hypothetical protein
VTAKSVQEAHELLKERKISRPRARRGNSIQKAAAHGFRVSDESLAIALVVRAQEHEEQEQPGRRPFHRRGSSLMNFTKFQSTCGSALILSVQ